MRLVILRDGEPCFVDDEDYNAVMQHEWFAAYNHKRVDGFINYYAMGFKHGAGSVGMHRWLLKPTPEIWVDHKDGCGWNNQRNNIRLCTPSQNGANSISARGKSGFRGVYSFRDTDKFFASIKVNGKNVYLGLFEHKLDAAMAWDRKAIEVWGEFAKTNLPREGYD